MQKQIRLSMTILARIMRILLDTDSIGRTALALEAKVNYSRFSQHLDWLYNKKLVEFLIEEGKVQVRITKAGREFALLFLDSTN